MNIIDNTLIVILMVISAIGTAAVYGYEESFEDEPYEDYADDEWEDTFDECWNCSEEGATGGDDESTTEKEVKCKGKECGKGKGKGQGKGKGKDKPPKPPRGRK